MKKMLLIYIACLIGAGNSAYAAVRSKSRQLVPSRYAVFDQEVEQPRARLISVRANHGRIGCPNLSICMDSIEYFSQKSGRPQTFEQLRAQRYQNGENLVVACVWTSIPLQNGSYSTQAHFYEAQAFNHEFLWPARNGNRRFIGTPNNPVNKVPFSEQYVDYFKLEQGKNEFVFVTSLATLLNSSVPFNTLFADSTSIFPREITGQGLQELLKSNDAFLAVSFQELLDEHVIKKQKLFIACVKGDDSSVFQYYYAHDFNEYLFGNSADLPLTFNGKKTDPNTRNLLLPSHIIYYSIDTRVPSAEQKMTRFCSTDELLANDDAIGSVLWNELKANFAVMDPVIHRELYPNAPTDVTEKPVILPDRHPEMPLEHSRLRGISSLARNQLVWGGVSVLVGLCLGLINNRLACQNGVRAVNMPWYKAPLREKLLALCFEKLAKFFLFKAVTKPIVQQSNKLFAWAAIEALGGAAQMLGEIVPIGGYRSWRNGALNTSLTSAPLWACAACFSQLHAQS